MAKIAVKARQTAKAASQTGVKRTGKTMSPKVAERKQKRKEKVVMMSRKKVAALFKPVVVNPISEHRWTMVYLHGFGSSAEAFHDAQMAGLEELGRYGVRVVMPNAPERKITFMGGLKMPAWYDYNTNSDGKKEDRPHGQILPQSIKALSDLLEHELELLDGDASRLLIAGASQGAVTALELVMRFRLPVGAFLGIAGVYSVQPRPQNKREVPLFFFNGTEDDVHMWQWVRPTVKRFFKSAETAVVRTCPLDHDELCTDQGSPFISAFLQSVCGESDESMDDVVDVALAEAGVEDVEMM